MERKDCQVLNIGTLCIFFSFSHGRNLQQREKAKEGELHSAYTRNMESKFVCAECR